MDRGGVEAGVRRPDRTPVGRMNDREKRIDNLSPSAVRFVARMADSLSSPPKASVRQEAAWITGCPDRIEYSGLSCDRDLTFLRTALFSPRLWRRVGIDEASILPCPIFGKSNMRDGVLAPIKFSFRLLNHDLRIDFIYGFAFRLLFSMEDSQIYFRVSGYSFQRFGTSIVRLFEHAIELSHSAFYARQIFVLFLGVVRGMSICLSLRVNQFMSKNIGDDHFLD